MSGSDRAQMMRYPQVLPEPLRRCVATIGNFDGVHRGHQAVLKELSRIADGRPSVVVSFYPHPLRILKSDSDLRYISSVREKAERCGACGVDVLYFVHFTEAIIRMTAREFIEKILVRALGVSDLVLGEDAAIGHRREGTLKVLQEMLPEYGIRLHVVKKLEIDGAKAGSRKIRELIGRGEVSEAARLIGGPFTISARVGHGDKRGSMIGFPTANIAVGNRLIPSRGVYACRVWVDGVPYAGVANIGVRPTFNGLSERFEVHILNFPPRSLYGTRIHVGFCHRLRDEKRFESVEELKKQIALDIKAALERLADA